MYRQITSGERYTLGALHAQGFSQAAIALHLGRHPSTVSRPRRRRRVFIRSIGRREAGPLAES